MTVKIVTNTTLATIELKEVGKDLAAGETYTIAPVQYPHWAYAARVGSFLETKILAGHITVSDGLVPSLDAALGLALLRDLLARNISFDNRTNSFVASNVQAAIEEAKAAATAIELDILFSCAASVAIGDIVVPSLTTDDTVEKLTSNVYSSLVVGFVSAKPTTTTCKVRIMGVLSGFSGLTRGLPVFVSTSGTPTTTFPATGHRQVLGLAKNATTIVINIEMMKVER